MRIKKILVSQPLPPEGSTYQKIKEQYKLDIVYRSFIEIAPIESRVLRDQKIKISEYTAIIFTSKNAVEQFFRISEEMKYKIPESLLYFCISETTSNYLQKFIVYKKRKVYVGDKVITDLLPHFKRHSTEKYLLPSSDTLKEDVLLFLNKLKLNWTRAVLYETIPSNLADVQYKEYDIIAFFSPLGVKSLLKNFPDFQQGQMKIAAFGKSTIETAEGFGLEVNIKAPTKKSPSMTMALEDYISKQNKK